MPGDWSIFLNFQTGEIQPCLWPAGSAEHLGGHQQTDPLPASRTLLHPALLHQWSCPSDLWCDSITGAWFLRTDSRQGVCGRDALAQRRGKRLLFWKTCRVSYPFDPAAGEKATRRYRISSACQWIKNPEKIIAQAKRQSRKLTGKLSGKTAKA